MTDMSPGATPATEPHRSARRPGDMPSGRLVAFFAVALLALSACAPQAPPSPTATPTPEPPSAAPSETPPPTGVDLSTVPTACIGIAADDCRRVVAEVAVLVPAGTVARYVQVGPFGCVAEAGCPISLAARPQGDVTIEAGAGALSYHITASGGGADLAIDRQDAFGVLVGPESTGSAAGVQPYTLGHCGLWSGIDAAGSWWDPVGQVDGDHADAINAAEGRLVIIDPDRATFTSRGGLTVQLVRHDGEKYLPLCQ